MTTASFWVPSVVALASGCHPPLSKNEISIQRRAQKLSSGSSFRIRFLSESSRSSTGSAPRSGTRADRIWRSCLGAVSSDGGVQVLKGYSSRGGEPEETSHVLKSVCTDDNGVIKEGCPGSKEEREELQASSATDVGRRTRRENADERGSANGSVDAGRTPSPSPNEYGQEKKSGTSGMRWSMLLSRTALEDAHLSRASSVTDAHVLRRKGRLKEQDGLIEFIISMHATHSPFQVMEKMETWVQEHLEDPKRSMLGRLVPVIDPFYTKLPLVQALQEYDEFASLSRRRYVPPNFAEIRHVLNIAQVHAIAGQISLLTFDADGTLYTDGHHIKRDSKMIDYIIRLLQEGVHVAIVTAAGYPGDAARYEDRFAGLLAAFKDLDLPPRITQLFHVVGGECNYLLRVKNDYHLEFVPDVEWQTHDMQAWAEEDVKGLLDEAEAALVSAAARLRLPVQLIRKSRAVGVVPTKPTIYEVLEEMALTVQVQLVNSKLPFCAFNGGSDVFVDVGNKSVGLEALMTFLRKGPMETLHVGDRFTVSGNDSATRSKCSVLWVANPEETGFFIRVLLREVKRQRLRDKERILI